MPVEINESQIAYAQECLIKGHQFDDERREFIKNLETIDLQAVPGSGKTTALLAKLVILEKHLPFPNGSGILVLSHTNAAVDEIKKEIQKYCPKLFSYPNFIGTIQSFVDEFLASPYYVYSYKSKPIRIDSEIYDEKVEIYYNKMLPPRNPLKSWLSRRNEPLEWLKKIRFNESFNLIPELNKTEDDFELKDKTTPTYRAIEKMKTLLLQWGYLHFDDAYLLGNCYIRDFPRIKKLLQKRFVFIFVDEMQDMDKHQSKLLEDLFYDNGESLSVYQRIGDKNQSIYGKKVHLEDFWEERNVLPLTGSLRLSPPIAKVVQNFALSPIEVIGLKKNDDDSDIEILPHLLLYDDDSKENIIPTFSQIIKDFKDNGKLPENSNNKYFAIAWNTVWKTEEEKADPNKIRLSDYYSKYSREEDKDYIDYSTLESYINFYDKSSQTLYAIRRNILNAFLRILRLEKIRDKENKNREFSKRRLLRHLQQNKEVYDEFKLNVFQWSLSIIKGNKTNVIDSIKDYVPHFLTNFEDYHSELKRDENPSVKFLNDPCPLIVDDSEEVEKLSKRNVIVCDDVEIQVGTVHSVKGQTHTATLYLESFYGRGYGNYESERLRNQFLEESLDVTLGKLSNSHELVKQSAKMAYVGFSRPTHLLCVGIHKDRFNEFLNDVPKDLWEIIEIN